MLQFLHYGHQFKGGDKNPKQMTYTFEIHYTVDKGPVAKLSVFSVQCQTWSKWTRL